MSTEKPRYDLHLQPTNGLQAGQSAFIPIAPEVTFQLAVSLLDAVHTIEDHMHANPEQCSSVELFQKTHSYLTVLHNHGFSVARKV